MTLHMVILGNSIKFSQMSPIRQGGKAVHVIHNHLTTITLKNIESIVKDKIVKAILHPTQVREQVAEIRKQNRPVVDQQEIEATVGEIRILGVRVTIYPLSGNYPFRWDVKMTVPGVLGKMNIVSSSRA